MPLRATRIWADTIRHKACEYPGCNARLWLAQNIRTGNYMVFEGEPAAISKTFELGTNREEWQVDLAAEHWSKCKRPAQFRRRGRV